jgi:hypothetical protein
VKLQFFNTRYIITQIFVRNDLLLFYQINFRLPKFYKLLICIFFHFFQVSHWSQKWFTHFFLFVVVFGYSLLGAFIFMAIESPHEQAIRADFFREKVSNVIPKQLMLFCLQTHCGGEASFCACVYVFLFLNKRACYIQKYNETHTAFLARRDAF